MNRARMGFREREARAQELAEYLAWNGACREHGQAWGVAERDHSAANTKWTARVAAAPALEMCIGCPALAQCAEWAEIDRYTGLAAGTAWIDGEPRPAEWPRNHRYRHEAQRPKGIAS